MKEARQEGVEKGVVVAATGQVRLIERGLLVPFRYYAIYDPTDYDYVKTTHGIAAVAVHSGKPGTVNIADRENAIKLLGEAWLDAAWCAKAACGNLF